MCACFRVQVQAPFLPTVVDSCLINSQSLSGAALSLLMNHQQTSGPLGISVDASMLTLAKLRTALCGQVSVITMQRQLADQTCMQPTGSKEGTKKEVCPWV